MEIESHDHNFKNLFLDFPKEALQFCLPEAIKKLGNIKRIEFDRQEPKKHHLKDPHLVLDLPIIFHFETESVVLWLVEFQEDKEKFSIYKLLKYTSDKMEEHPAYTVVPTVLFTDRKNWAKDVKRSIETKLFDRILLHFEYVFIKLYDYKARDYFNVDNPLVKILLPKMSYTKEERWEVIRQAFIGLHKLVNSDLFVKYSYFIDVYSEIDEIEKKRIDEEIVEKKEAVMIVEYLTERGGQKTGSSILCNLLNKRFKVDRNYVNPLLNRLESNDLMELGDMILDYEQPEPIFAWIDERIAVHAREQATA